MASCLGGHCFLLDTTEWLTGYGGTASPCIEVVCEGRCASTPVAVVEVWSEVADVYFEVAAMFSQVPGVSRPVPDPIQFITHVCWRGQISANRTAACQHAERAINTRV